jgi:hypothetical protein
MAAQVVHCCKRQLICLAVLQLVVVLKEQLFVASAVRDIEQQACLEGRVRALGCRLTRLLVPGKEREWERGRG